MSTAARILRRPVAVLSAAWIALVVVVSVFPGLVTGQDPLAQNLSASLQGPSSAHPLGTDILGRDLLSRLAHGGGSALWGMTVALVIALLLGVTLGLVAGYLGGLADTVISRAAEILFALPGIIILLVVVAVFPHNITAAMAVFGALAAPGLIRIVRGATIATREELFVAAARVLGLSRRQIITRHLAPRLSSLVIVQASLIAALALVLQSGLGFLGFGPAPPSPSWGGLITDALNVLGRDPWAMVPPGAAIGLTALALALLGDSIRDATTESWATSKLATRRRGRLVAPAPVPGDITGGDTSGSALLSVRHMSIAIPMASGLATVVDDVSFEVAPGETVGIVGESGCGKTVTILGILGLVPGNGMITGGACLFRGRDLVRLLPRDLAAIRGTGIGFISQEPSVSLDPTFRIGSQLAEAVRRHRGVSRAAARQQAVALLAQVRLPEPEAVARRYPHQISGGMAQRVSIAYALAGEPSLLIADEPTTALDVTVQAEILDLLRLLRDERGLAVLIVTHDWGVIADLCDRAVVMYAGQVAESAPVTEMFLRPLQPYTQSLLRSNPALPSAAGKRLPAIAGTVPPPGQWPSGCRFAPRCALATAECSAAPVPLAEPAAGHESRCIKADELRRKALVP